MYRRLLKKSTAVILASALIFSSSTVYAQEAEAGKADGLVESEQPLEDNTQKKDSEISKDEDTEDVQKEKETGNTEEKEEIQESETDISKEKEVSEKSGDSQTEENGTDKTESSDVNAVQSEETVKKETADTKETEELSVSIPVPEYEYEAGTGIASTLAIRLNNDGTETVSISSEDYEVKIVPVGEAADAGINFEDMQEELDSKGRDFQPGESMILYPQYTIPQDYTGKTMDYKVQLIEKASGDAAAESQVISVNVFSIENGVLKYHDTAKGEKYLITFDKGDGVTFEGSIGGGGGNSTVIGSGPDIGSYQYYLDPGHPSSFIFGTPEGKSIDTELIPSDAGTAEKMWMSSPNIVSIDLHAPATLKVTVTDKHVLYGENGFSVSAPTTDKDAQILLGSVLETGDFTDQAAIDELKEWVDSYARIQGYTLKITLPGDWDYTRFIPKGEMTVTIPVPEGWDASRTQVYTVNEYGFNGPLGSVSQDGKSISFKTKEFSETDTLNCVLMERSIPTEVKDWERVVTDYYETVRAVNWFREPLEEHYFDSVPSANDAAYVAYHFSGKFYTDSSYYDPETSEIRIPYEDLAQEVARYYKNVPDLTAVYIPDYISYDAAGNQFILPVGGGAGDSPYTYKIVDTKEVQGVYAIWFEIAEENAQCTLMVEDNGNGDWRYVSFLEGFQEPEAGDTEEPENPGDVEQPEDPDDTEQPEEPDDTEQPENPGELSQAQIQDVIKEIQNAAAGKTIPVSMGSATIVPEEILESAKGRNVTIELKMNGYAWIINGRDITASDIKDINLEVRTDVNAISKEEIRKLAGDNPVKQITLTHSGDFGFKAVLKIYLGTEYSEKYGNLFWFKNSSTSELVDTDKIDKEGFAEFTFTHASDYVIVVDDQDRAAKDSNTVKGQGATSAKTTKSVKTGDSSAPVLYAGMLGIAGILFAGALKKRKIKK